MLTLYDAARCPYCARVRILLADKGCAVRAGRGRPRRPPGLDYGKNVTGRVPVLEEDEGLVLPEPRVIMEYLEERFPEPSLWPADASARAAGTSPPGTVRCALPDPTTTCSRTRAGPRRNASGRSSPRSAGFSRRVGPDRTRLRPDQRRLLHGSFASRLGSPRPCRYRRWRPGWNTSPSGVGPGGDRAARRHMDAPYGLHGAPASCVPPRRAHVGRDPEALETPSSRPNLAARGWRRRCPMGPAVLGLVDGRSSRSGLDGRHLGRALATGARRISGLVLSDARRPRDGQGPCRAEADDGAET